ncbi:hypothetical protein PCANC_17891 [Puccinia coronata f. sp. avenae]|uniref:Uncharacterized protein n=1 Tax=Puccinia coronata f. sp. avenae TaxID=200324 RepID=A0A2N5SKH6_9BASI|nr:hypothetical protein PCANC_17891 [Puccinia coronata f. sp. avenae]
MHTQRDELASLVCVPVTHPSHVSRQGAPGTSPVLSPQGRYWSAPVTALVPSWPPWRPRYASGPGARAWPVFPDLAAYMFHLEI